VRSHRGDTSTHSPGEDRATAATPGKHTLTQDLRAIPPVQRKAAPATDAAGPASAPDTAAPTGGGRPLPDAVRARMERALRADFSAVRVHEGPQASAIGALAFTRGTDIFFAPGQYDPESQRGQELLGHELAHVVQQAQGRVQTTNNRGGVGVDDSAGLEHEADQLGANASVAGAAVADAGATAAPTAGRAAGDAAPVQAKDSEKFAGAHDKPGGTVKHFSGNAVDALLGASKLLSPYVKAQRDAGVKAEGRVFFYSSKDFVEAWVKYALTRSNPSTGKLFTEAEARAWVPRAFTADDGGMHIDENAGEPRTAIHESIHFYQSNAFRNLGWHISEGFTEHFTQALIKEQKVVGAGTNPALANPWAAANKVVAATSLDAAAQAYFSGSIATLEGAVDKAKGAGTFAKWKGYMKQNPPDFAAANALL
jgi:hypothetical protein